MEKIIKSANGDFYIRMGENGRFYDIIIMATPADDFTEGGCGARGFAWKYSVQFLLKTDGSHFSRKLFMESEPIYSVTPIFTELYGIYENLLEWYNMIYDEYENGDYFNIRAKDFKEIFA